MKLLLFVITNLGLFTSTFAANMSAESTDILTCYFSEHSAQLNFDIANGVVTYTDDKLYDPQTSKQQYVSLSPRATFVGAKLDHYELGSTYRVITSDGEDILSLKLSFTGFDGSSVFLLYPFEAEFYAASGDVLKGGCSIPARPYYEVVELSND